MKKRRVVKNESSLPRSIARGVGILAITYILVTLAVTVAALITDDPTGKVGLLSTVALVIAGGIGGFIAAKKLGVRIATVSALVIAIVLSVIGGVSSGNTPSIWSILNAGGYVLSAAVLARIASTGRRGARRIRR